MDNNRNQAPVSPLAYEQEGRNAQGGDRPAEPSAQEQAAPAQEQSGSRSPKKKRERSESRNGFGKTLLAGFLGALIAVVLGFGGLAVYNNVTGSGSSSVVIGSTSSTTIDAEDTDSELAVAVADKVLPSIVCIDVYTEETTSTNIWDQYLQDDSDSSSLTYSGLGSGVIISDEGYILTNYHVIEGAAQLMVTADGEEYEAEIVGTDETSDLAVIKIEADGLTAIEIGSSDDLQVGQWVMTAGSPFGLEQSVATGIISATSRTITVSDSTNEYSYDDSSSDVSIYSNMIQTDAAINPGNSGGALVDSDGKLIGINSVFSSSSGSYAGVGFAIPVDYAINIAQQIIDGETPTHAFLGVSTTTITSDLATRFGLDVTEGAYVSAVYSGSAADECGLQEGDIIIAVDDTDIASATDLTGATRSHDIGDTVTITYVRDGQTQTVEATLGSDEDY